MSNDYFNQVTWATRQTNARASDVNNLAAAVKAGFDKLPTEAEIKSRSNPYAPTTGSSNAYVATAADVIFNLTLGARVWVKVHADNTAASSLNFNSTGARPIKRADGSDLLAGDLPAGKIVGLIYDGANYVFLATPPEDFVGAAYEYSIDLKDISVALSGTTPTASLSAGEVFSLTTSGNTTISFSNAPAPPNVGSLVLILTAGGSHTVSFSGTIKWDSGIAPSAPASGGTDVLTFLTVDGGTTWYGFLIGEAMA